MALLLPCTLMHLSRAGNRNACYMKVKCVEVYKMSVWFNDQSLREIDISEEHTRWMKERNTGGGQNAG